MNDRPEEITNQHVMGKLKRDGKKKTSEWLQSLGTDEAQAEEYIMVPLPPSLPHLSW